jgi:hypothetical protein
MGLDVHTVEMIDGAQFNRTDRTLIYIATVANAAGSGVGTTVTTAVTANLPAAYNVQVTPSQGATAAVTGKTNTGFNVVLSPNPATATLAVGTFDVLITA